MSDEMQMRMLLPLTLQAQNSPMEKTSEGADEQMIEGVSSRQGLGKYVIYEDYLCMHELACCLRSPYRQLRDGAEQWNI